MYRSGSRRSTQLSHCSFPAMAALDFLLALGLSPETSQSVGEPCLLQFERDTRCHSISPSFCSHLLKPEFPKGPAALGQVASGLSCAWHQGGKKNKNRRYIFICMYKYVVYVCNEHILPCSSGHKLRLAPQRKNGAFIIERLHSSKCYEDRDRTLREP